MARSAKFNLIETGGVQILWRWTKFSTLILKDEFRTTEMLRSGVFVSAWSDSSISCNTPAWTKRAARKVLFTHKRPACAA